MKNERQTDQKQKARDGKEDSTSLSDIDREDISEDSEEDEAFLAKYGGDGNFIGSSILWSQGTLQFPPALQWSRGEHSLW